MTEPTSDLPALYAVGEGPTYRARLTKVRNRQDVEILDPRPVDAFESADPTPALREFFMRLATEAEAKMGDPVALTHALARLETLLADIRSVRDSVRSLTANALESAFIRRLTVSGVATVEAERKINRTGWQHEALLTRLLTDRGVRMMDPDGVVMNHGESARWLLIYVTPDWKLTPLREVGIEPDGYCTVQRDDDGKAVSTPGVKMVDNVIRRNG